MSDWTSEIPTEPGVYEFRRSDIGWVDKVEVFRDKGLLFGKIKDVSISMSGFESKGPYPQWRRAYLGKIQTPDTDAAVYECDRGYEVVSAEVARELEIRLAAAEKLVTEWREYSTSHGREIARLLEEVNAWKSVALRLGAD